MKSIVISIFCVAFSLTLSGCYYESRPFYKEDQLGPPQIDINMNKDNKKIETVTEKTPIFPALPKSFNNVENSKMIKIDNLESAKGLKFTPLFAVPLATSEERFKRLETVVQKLRNNVDVLMLPPVIEKKPVIKDNVTEGNNDLKQKEVKKDKVKIEKKKTYDFAVKKIRMADHKNKTRIVLDMTGDSSAKVNIQNKGKELVIDLKNLDWQTKKTWEADSGNLISGYRVNNNKLYVDLMYSSVISKKMVLKSNGKIKYYRLVVDLFSKDVHE